MCCLSKKDIIMLYYNELEEGEKIKYKEHLKDCNRCRKIYEEIQDTLSRIEAQPLEFAYQDMVDEAVKEITSKQREITLWQRLRYSIEQLRDNWFWRLNYRPQRAIVTLAIILLVFIYPWRKKIDVTQKQFEILEIEMELSLQNLEEITLFDLLEEESMDEESLLIPPTPQNSSEVIHIKT